MGGIGVVGARVLGWRLFAGGAAALDLGDPEKGSPPGRPRPADVPGQGLVQRRKAGAPARAGRECEAGAPADGEGLGQPAGSPGSASRAAAATFSAF